MSTYGIKIEAIRQFSIHTVYWTVSFLFLWLLYGLIGSLQDGLVYAALNLPICMVVVYLFILGLVPGLLFKSRPVLFVLSAVLLMTLTLSIQIVVVLLKRIVWLLPDYPNISAIFPDITFLLLGGCLISFPAILYETLRQRKHETDLIRQMKQEQDKSAKSDYLVVRSDGKTHRLDTKEIRYIESYGDYAHFHLENEKLVSRFTLKELEDQLSGFIRVHRSYLVNPLHCGAYDSESIMIDKKEIPIGRTYKERMPESLFPIRG